MCAWQIQGPPLAEWDERTNAEVVTASLRTDSPWLLTLTDGPFFEKPPLWYYLAEGSTFLLGESRTALRLVSVLAGYFTVWLVVWLGTQWFGRLAGLISGVVLLLTGQLWHFNPGEVFSTHHFRSADTEGLLLLMMTAAIWQFWRHAEGYRSGWWLGVGFAGLAVMTKGLLGLLPLFCYLSYRLVSNHWVKWRDLLLAVVILVLIILPWHLMMWWVHGDAFVQTYFGYHQWARATSVLENHQGGVMFYVDLLAERTTFSFIEGLLIAIGYAIWRTTRRIEFRWWVPLLLIGGQLLIVTMVKTKLAWYVLPVYPMVSLLIAGTIMSLWQEYRSRAIEKAGR